jgi:hypothetical protein
MCTRFWLACRGEFTVTFPLEAVQLQSHFIAFASVMSAANQAANNSFAPLLLASQGPQAAVEV